MSEDIRGQQFKYGELPQGKTLIVHDGDRFYATDSPALAMPCRYQDGSWVKDVAKGMAAFASFDADDVVTVIDDGRGPLIEPAPMGTEA